MPMSAVFMQKTSDRAAHLITQSNLCDSPSVGSYNPGIIEDIGLKSKIRHGVPGSVMRNYQNSSMTYHDQKQKVSEYSMQM